MTLPAAYSTTRPTPSAALWRALAQGACECAAQAAVSNRRCRAHQLTWGGPGRRHQLIGHVRTVAADERSGRMRWDADFGDRIGHHRIQATIDLQVSPAGSGSRVHASGRVRALGRLIPVHGMEQLSEALLGDLVTSLARRATVPPSTADPVTAPESDDRWITELAAMGGVLATVTAIAVAVWRRSNR